MKYSEAMLANDTVMTRTISNLISPVDGTLLAEGVGFVAGCAACVAETGAATGSEAGAAIGSAAAGSTIG